MTMINFQKSLPNTKVIVHWEPWWGSSGHISLNYTLRNGQVIPYQSWNPLICDDQCQNMLEMGVYGINVDYYGESEEMLSLNTATLVMMDSCNRNGLKFSICIDEGGIKATGSEAQAQYLSVMQYLSETMFPNSAYLVDSTGKPIVNFFGEPAGINWATLQTSAPGMTWLFEDNPSHVAAGGIFGWVKPSTPANNWNQAYITGFNASAAANKLLAWYPLYVGFDDGAASWGSNRFMSRLCGQTLLNTVGMVPKTAQYALVSTWNDHEEGSNLENLV